MSSSGGDDLNAEINVTPLVDVMLVLLIIFMITAPMMNTGVDIELPQSETKNIEDPEGKLIMSIDANRKLFLSGTQIQWQELEVKIKANAKVQREGEIYIEADTTLPYGVVVTAMAMIKNAGVPKVMLLTESGKTLSLKELDQNAGR